MLLTFYHKYCFLVQSSLLVNLIWEFCLCFPQAISSADTVVLIDKGQVTWIGSPSPSSIDSFIAPSMRQDFNISSEVQNQDIDVNVQQNVLVESDDILVLEDDPYAIDVEQRKEGRVEPVTYK